MNYVTTAKSDKLKKKTNIATGSLLELTLIIATIESILFLIRIILMSSSVLKFWIQNAKK